MGYPYTHNADFRRAFLYYYAGSDCFSEFQDKRRVGAKKSEKLLFSEDCGFKEACAALPEHAPQIRYLNDFAKFPIYTKSTTKYFSPGEEMFKALLAELEKAEKYIFLEYFIIQEGNMWNSILDILKRKAANGVTVRVMYDDFGCFFLLPSNYPAQLKKYGIECVVFNPFRPMLTAVQNNRDHRKIASIDGKTVFTGGINLADEYINAYEKHGHWKDSAVMVKGAPREFYSYVPANVGNVHRHRRRLRTILSLERDPL